MKFDVDILRKHYSQLRSELNSVRGMLSLVAGLREFFREPVTLEKTKEEIRRALDNREQRFLDLVQAQVYGRAGSPYLKLLRMAGCDFADLEALIRKHGLENSLQRLAEEGVYLTSDEFRGKKDVVRGQNSFCFSPGDLELRTFRRGLMVSNSSGTRHRPQRYALSLDRTSQLGRLKYLFFSAHNLLHHSHAIYDATLPTSEGIRNLLLYGKCGIRVKRWFARRVPMGSWPEATYHYLMTYLIVLETRSFSPGAPWPEFVDSEEAYRIVHWIAKENQAGKACCIRTAASNAVRIARAAREMGRSLAGTKFIVSGEPFTESKRELIEGVDGSAIPIYGCSGLGEIGSGCANPVWTDDVHVPCHRLAVIEHPRALNGNGPPVNPFLFTTFSELDPLLHMNVQNGDYGVMETRECGCAIGNLGLTLHLHRIRSFEKLTSEGMGYSCGDLYELLEKSFPAEFGGGPGDYQLVEEEDGNGQTRLSLVVHPEVGNLDEGQVLARLRAAFSNGSRGNRFMTEVWESAGTFRIRREVPYASLRGKILPLHISQNKAKTFARHPS
jgi:hypothetical protein